MAESTDEPLAVSRRAFVDAVHAFVERQPVWDRGVARWSPALYTRVRGSLTGTPARRGHRMPTSRAPARSDVMAWLVEVDQEVARWSPGGGTIDRLKSMAAASWRPQDCEVLDGHTARLEQWTVKAVELLGDAPVEVALRLPCPSCGKKFVYRRLSNGENVRSWALRVGENGARCLAGCNASWGVERLEFLATLVNCQPLPGS